VNAGKPKDIDSYIAESPAEVRAKLQALRTTIHRAAPDAVEAIRYDIPTFVQGESLVHFAAFRNHIGFYPSPSGIAAFRKQLAGYKSSKGSVQFPLDRPLPLELVARIVKFRVEEVTGRAKRKS
jgi:uncharacterized protein YdhG (YjbR/CyaY superfamily)